MTREDSEHRVVAITGASGYIGSEVLALLESMDFRLIDLRRSWMPQLCPDNVSRLEFDLLGDSPWKQVPIEEIDYIVHLAAIDLTSEYNPFEDVRVNAISVLSLLENVAVRNPNVKIIYASSSNVYGYTDGRIVNESDPVLPLSLWSTHKYLAESYIRIYQTTHSIRSIILRLPNVYGVGSGQGSGLLAERSALNRAIRSCLDSGRLSLFSNRDCFRDYLHVKDVSSAIVEAIGQFSSLFEKQVLNIGFQSSRTIRETWEIVAEYCAEKTGGVPQILTLDRAMSPFELRSFRLDGSCFVKSTGWKPEFTIQQGVKFTVDSFSS